LQFRAEARRECVGAREPLVEFLKGQITAEYTI